MGVLRVNSIKSVVTFLRATGKGAECFCLAQTHRILAFLPIVFTLSFGFLFTASSAAYAADKPTEQHKASKEPIGNDLISYIKSRKDTVSIEILDKTTGKTYVYNPDKKYGPASTFKIFILGALLYQTQVHRRPLTAREKALATSMIEYSDNDAATDLYRAEGSYKGMNNFLAKIGAKNRATTSAWGLNYLTPHDEVYMMDLFTHPNPYFDEARRKFALSLLGHVTPSQRWGVSSGVPSGSLLAIKNGWSPYVEGNWRINSVGWINGHGKNYVICVMTFQNPTMQYGIETIQYISRYVWSHM
jgi:hypothetical protein